MRKVFNALFLINARFNAQIQETLIICTFELSNKYLPVFLSFMKLFKQMSDTTQVVTVSCMKWVKFLGILVQCIKNMLCVLQVNGDSSRH